MGGSCGSVRHRPSSCENCGHRPRQRDELSHGLCQGGVLSQGWVTTVVLERGAWQLEGCIGDGLSALAEDKAEPSIADEATNAVDDVEEKLCRICQCTESEAPEMGKLFSPCKCKGSVRYVHEDCLN